MALTVAGEDRHKMRTQPSQYSAGFLYALFEFNRYDKVITVFDARRHRCGRPDYKTLL